MATTTDRHPPQLKVLFFTEMWERFGFYLMLGIFLQYLSDKEKGGLGWTDLEAASLNGSYIALVYLTPFIGGILADRILGFRRSIVIGAMLMMLGYFCLAIASETAMYLGILIVILGNGAFKPNISTLLGNLYPPGSPLKDTGYNIFYMGINIGAFLCNFVAAIVRNYFDEHSEFGIRGWHAAFATAGIGMFIGLVIFAFNYRSFAPYDPDRRTMGPRESLTPLWLRCLVPAAAMAFVGWLLAANIEGFPFKPPTAAFLGACLPVIFFYIGIWRGLPEQGERNRVLALLVVFAVVIVFWMTFHLNTSALNFWARDDTNRVPSGPAKLVTDSMPAFAENAPPKYYKNADPDVPRPSRDTLKIVSDKEYEELEKAGKLSVETNKPVYVTQAIYDSVYKRANSETPYMPEGQHLKLVNTELFQSINAGQVILFTPLLVGFWRLLRQRNLEPTTPAKMGIGLLITAGAPTMMLLATWASDNSAMKVSWWWLFATYAVATLGELCLSPMGLSLVNKVAPARISAFMMGGYFLSTSFGNKLSGIFGEVYTEMNHYYFWTILIVCNLVFGAFIFIMLPWLKRQMGGALH
jgi:POT family proton-dependent oligopeptide transporter